MATTDERDEEQTFDPESRRLCPDDTCTGLVGPDGRCKVCGAVSPEGPAPISSEDAAPAGERAPDPDVRASAKDDHADFDPDDRVLCADDTCTGLVGGDGRCKVCGKPRAP